MENRIALIGIVVEDIEATEKINTVLHEYNKHLVGRLGIPYKERGVAIISIVVDASNDIISSLSGKLGMIKGTNVSTAYSKISKSN